MTQQWLVRQVQTLAARRMVRVPRLQSAKPRPSSMPPRPPNFGRAVAFFGGVALVSYGACAAISVRQSSRLDTPDVPLGLVSFFTSRTSADERLAVAKAHDDAYKLGTLMQRVKRRMDQLAVPQSIQEPLLSTYLWLSESWLELSPQKSALAPIIAINACVFAAWHVPRLGAYMARWFVHRPCSGRAVTLLTSVYSHKSIGHYAFNNIALWSIGSASLSVAAVSAAQHTPEASPMPHFFAFFATAGTFAALVSHVAAAARFRALSQRFGSRWRAITRSKPAAVLNVVGRGSLGSSGAVYAALVLTALVFPQAGVSLIFLPMTSVPIQWGVTGLVALDVLGLVRGWRMFDHAAHLGGALFGALYYIMGPEAWEAAKRLSRKLADGRQLVE